MCADSMGREINSGVLIMQRGDTDLILCLSTCADILMHSVPATLWHRGGFHTLCSKPGKRRHLVFDRGYITATRTTLMKTESVGLGVRGGDSAEMHIFILANAVNAKCLLDNWG